MFENNRQKRSFSLHQQAFDVFKLGIRGLSKPGKQTLQTMQARPFCVKKYWFFLILFLWPLVTWAITAIIPPPSAVARDTDVVGVTHFDFLIDDSYLSAAGDRVLEQQIFDQVFDMIRNAQSLIVLDMFLFNGWQGPVKEAHRQLAAELTDTLIAKRSSDPDISIVVITDPINTVYGGQRSEHLDALQAANILVVMTDLARLQDSNPVWSSLWRWLVRPLGNGTGGLLPNPFGEGRVSLRSYLALFNFKANHRKLLIADNADGVLEALVSSANPHDGSSAHRNVALRFGGPAVRDLLDSERSLLEMSGASEALTLIDNRFDALDDAQFAMVAPPAAGLDIPGIQVISESRIRDEVLTAIDATGKNDRIDMAMFYLSHRQIVRALVNAAKRGVTVRVILDVNLDAFGRRKNGVPNRPVAAELHAAGVKVRWCKTVGEQCHAKWLHTETHGNDEALGPREHRFFIGSANFTRRNLDDFNLETDVLLLLGAEHPMTARMINFFERQWENRESREYTIDYDIHADDSVWLRWQYRLMEATGLSTF